jgi:formylglycine-generating enzyme required for sulfatase activity
MVPIPAGAFVMGLGSDEAESKLAHEVTVGAFFIDRTEVTVAKYQACADAGVCPKPAPSQDCNQEYRDKRDHPVNCVDFASARADEPGAIRGGAWATLDPTGLRATERLLAGSSNQLSWVGFRCGRSAAP